MFRYSMPQNTSSTMDVVATFQRSQLVTERTFQLSVSWSAKVRLLWPNISKLHTCGTLKRAWSKDFGKLQRQPRQLECRTWSVGICSARLRTLRTECSYK